MKESLFERKIDHIDDRVIETFNLIPEKKNQYFMFISWKLDKQSIRNKES